MKASPVTLGTVAGALVAPVAIVTSVISGGAGHGHYIAARCWFPFTMASTYFLGSITVPFLIVAVVQYPLYGWMIGRALAGKEGRASLWVLGGLHVVCALLLFVQPPRFFE